MILIHSYDSPIGRMTMAAEENALIGLWFDGQKYDRYLLKNKEPEKVMEGSCGVFADTARWLSLYFEGDIPDFMPNLRVSGSEFQQKVLQILGTIPYGYTMTYGEVAHCIAKSEGLERMSAQAVGGAIGHNPISILIPCHRILGRNGKMTGYAGGLDRKHYLLELEGICHNS